MNFDNEQGRQINVSKKHPLPSSLSVIGQDGASWEVVNGKGLGIRQHDDVMLSYGYSQQIEVVANLSAGDYLLVELTVDAAVKHHAESRFVEAFNGAAELWIIPNYTGAVPASPDVREIWNQKGPYLVAEEDKNSHFQTWTQATLPIDFDPALLANRNKWITYRKMHGSTGQGNTSSSAGAFVGLKGRYYLPGRHLALFKAIDNCEVTYIYNWHDFT